MITFTCEVCGKDFKRYPADVRKGGGKTCSVLCRNRRIHAIHHRSVEERFWSFVKKTRTCWLWTGAHSSDGYGMIGETGNTSQTRATRLSWRIHHGEDPPRHLHVLHKCDNPPCVRPDHLFLGTDGDNSRDSIRKDRHCRGERNHSAKLTPDQVASIKREYVRCKFGYRPLAGKYGVTKSTIQRIVEGKGWTHLLT